MITAVYDHTARQGFKEDNKKSVSPKKLLKYMLECAKNRPRAMAILQMVWFWELVILVRKAERTNNLDLFFSCCRMSMILFSTTNATE